MRKKLQKKGDTIEKTVFLQENSYLIKDNRGITYTGTQVLKRGHD